MSATYQLSNDVALITLDRPDRFNAIEASLSGAVIDSLTRAGEEARAVVLTGSGKAFCSGADLADLIEDYRKDGPDLHAHLEKVFHPLVNAMLDCRVPIVGAINGVAAGAGLGLALACDIRVMAQSSTFTSAFTGIGLVPDSGTTWWLPQMIGVSRALEFTMTNRRMSAEEALALGLCVEVCDGEVLVDRALEIATQLADLSPDALVSTRRLIRSAAGQEIEVAMAQEQTEQGRLGKTPEHLEGVNAFLEKRKPDFRNAQ